MSFRNVLSNTKNPDIVRPKPPTSAFLTKNDAMMKTIRHVAIRVGYRYTKGQKPFDMKALGMDLAIEGAYAFFLEDMLIIYAKKFITNKIVHIIFNTLVKSGLQAVGMKYIGKGGALKKLFTEALMENGIVEIVDEMYTVLMDKMDVSEDGKKNFLIF